jgi:pantoate--beta-alanine ligase
MELIKSTQEMRKLVDNIRSEGKTIGFVPTMGFLHEGHLSLVRMCRQKVDRVVVSIFVNPTQFGPTEDFESYPRDLDRDLRLLRNEAVDIVFAPPREDLYGSGHETYVKLERMPNHLCGLSRPVLFQGVATIVTKLFHIVKPHVAVFGEKDYQQLMVIRKMVKDLSMDIEILGGPTVREPDGLAMSSRNSYLTPSQRKTAACLFQSLKASCGMVAAGVIDTAQIIRKASENILSQPDTRIDYVSICDPESLEPVEKITGSALMALAVFVGRTRLIDNMMLASKNAKCR